MRRLLFSMAIVMISFQILAQSAFRTTWETATPDESITIPTYDNETYNYDVDWGDGTVLTGCTGDATHHYSTPGQYQVAVTGEFPRIYINGGDDRARIISIDQWGDIAWTSMEYAFAGCNNLVVQAGDVPDLSGVRSMRGMFAGASIFNQDIGSWDVSNVTDMSWMFLMAKSFNGDISEWDVSNVRDMSAMFCLAETFDQDISTWDVSRVEDMSWMFSGHFPFLGSPGTVFNQDIGNWDVSHVKKMVGMFWYAQHFDQDISKWDVSNVNDMEVMFAAARLSTENYDALLNGWSGRNLQHGVKFNGGESEYCSGDSARSHIINAYGWTIIDGGREPGCVSSAQYPHHAPEIRVYPNPADDHLTVDLGLLASGEVFITIYDFSGRLVHYQRHESIQGTVDIRTDQLDKGIYVVGLVISGEVVMEKIMVMHQ